MANNKSIRMRLHPEEADLVNELRAKRHAALSDECDTVGIPIERVNYYWYKGQNFSINVSGEDDNIKELMDKFIEEVKKYAPKYKPVKYTTTKEPHLLVIDPADIHIGKLSKLIETGDEYNHDIAVERVLDAVSCIIDRAKPYQIDQVLLIIGNDILHTDTINKTTTSGTPQDTSLMWFDAFKVAQKLITDCIEMIYQISPIHVVYNPSNHDKMSGFFLAQTLEAWFKNNNNITFDITPSHRKYYRYHNNIIGSCHGDGAKEQDLPLLMAHECEYWSTCKHKYFYTHHIHHKKSKDYMGVTVESMRSPSGADGWHSKQGFQHAPKGIDAFIHHPKHGQLARFSHIF